jgi:hypothetical protein
MFARASADPEPGELVLAVGEVFRAAEDDTRGTEVFASASVRRRRLGLADGTDVLADRFPDQPGAVCCFLRLPRAAGRSVRLAFDGVDEALGCAAGGWLLRGHRPGADAAVYWIPQLPVCRTLDANGRILSQQGAELGGFGSSAEGLWVDVGIAADMHLDLAVWRLSAQADAHSGLNATLAIERQRWFLRSSHATIERVADVYQCLVHGWVYDNRFVWRRIWGGFRWRICSENEAHSLYMALSGLERATGRILYALLKRQIVASIVSRLAPDGGWHHGEWTDLMESHFRLHSAGVLVLAAALEETPDPVLARAFEAAAAFLAGKADRTEAGLWFLHDALEESVERAAAKDAPPWTPTRMLGASAANKLILNTHLDSIVALDRYREISGDARHAAAVESARSTARNLLGRRPAEGLYRLAYRAVRLTLLPSAKAVRLSLPARAVRRLARERLLPNLYRLKRRHPRLVMPGGLIDRHLSPKHFDMGYHPVNLMDIVRLWRRFPQDDYRAIVQGAVQAVTDTGLLQFWLESRHIQPIGYWVEALYHLCTLDDSLLLRAHLAEAMLRAEDAGLGQPPALLGADAEAAPVALQTPCPSPREPRLRLANLGRGARREFLVVNPAQDAIALDWDAAPPAGIRWAGADGQPAEVVAGAMIVAARGWLLGRGG